MIASLLLALLAGSGPGVEIDVRKAGADLIDVRVRAPLSEVLDRIARETGMKVVYEGGQPRQVIAAEMHGTTVSRAVLGLLEGQGLSYLLALDPSGRTVTNLVMFGGGRAGGAAAAPPPPGGGAAAAEPVNDEEYVEEDEEDVPEPEPEPEPTPEQKPSPVGQGGAPNPGIPTWNGGAPSIPTWNGGAQTPFTPGMRPPGPTPGDPAKGKGDGGQGDVEQEDDQEQ